jgi:hypothetical protein
VKQDCDADLRLEASKNDSSQEQGDVVMFDVILVLHYNLSSQAFLYI